MTEKKLGFDTIEDENRKLTVDLFRNLSDEERKYLQENECLQASPKDQQPFAITFSYFHSLCTKLKDFEKK